MVWIQDGCFLSFLDHVGSSLLGYDLSTQPEFDLLKSLSNWPLTSQWILVATFDLINE